MSFFMRALTLAVGARHSLSTRTVLEASRHMISVRRIGHAVALEHVEVVCGYPFIIL